MKIGINLLFLKPGMSGGIEIYIKNLINYLGEMDSQNRYVLFMNSEGNDSFCSSRKNIQILRLKIKARPIILRILVEQIYLPVVISKLGLDVLHSPSYTWPIIAKTNGVVTVCDMLYKAFPKFMDCHKYIFWRLLVPLSIHRCKRVITISKNSKKDIIKYLKVNPEKVLVTPLALDKEISGMKKPTEDEIAETCKKKGIKLPYFLNVGGIGRHKNPLILIKALKILRDWPIMKDVSLVITGRDYGVRRNIEEIIAAFGLEEYVRLPGFVCQKDLAALYAGAFAYVSPSYYEGFGLTILEAMAFGTPVIASDQSALPEVAGDAAMLIKPDDAEQLAECLYEVKINNKKRNEMINRGYHRLTKFTWEKCARLTMDAYEQAARQI